ncbi:hypothetical protein NY2A_b776R [Paramecium bursaria Chlorella virus NY2A]|uniref:Uncharacterized protein b776R n=1 Tax=Paramecium bursaria Chlorella virus NY2A TaxID=46021 RepID=A7IXV1_PBCVN|nr:hypothetical protein NY2A_b776R [Paramecium bursaria Chlorella virus NY2A]ABT15175.1 hypothetical protein NY2A_b776R [Paramecium bursaria Chlorella virus NY2A]
MLLQNLKYMKLSPDVRLIVRNPDLRRPKLSLSKYDISIRCKVFRFSDYVKNLVSIKQPRSTARLGSSTPCRCGRYHRS